MSWQNKHTPVWVGSARTRSGPKARAGFMDALLTQYTCCRGFLLVTVKGHESPFLLELVRDHQMAASPNAQPP